MSNRAGDQEAIESTNNRNLERRLTLRRFRLAAAGVSDVAHVKTFSAEWMGLIFFWFGHLNLGEIARRTEIESLASSSDSERKRAGKATLIVSFSPKVN